MRALWLLSLVAVLCGLSRGAWGQQSHAATDPSPPNPRSVQYDPDDDYYDDGDDEPGQPALPPGNVYPSPYDDDPGYDYQKDMARSRKREVEGDLSKILGDDDYDYCRDLEYRVRSGEYHLCKLKEAAKARCPGFAAACDKPPIEDKGSLLGGGGAKRTTRRGEEKPDEPKASPSAPSVSSGMSGAAAVVFWALLIGLALLLIFSVARNFRREDVAEKADDPAPIDEGDEFVPRPKRSIVETDVDRLLALARAAAQAGDYDQAMSSAHAALLRYLDGNGLIELHHSRTNGEYARHLREHPQLQAAFRASAREVEAVQFGAAQSGADGFRRVMERILPVLGRVAALLLALCVASPLVACSSSGSPSKPKSTASGDTSPSGVSILQSLLVERGSEVRHMDTKVETIPEDVHTLVVHGPTDLESSEWTSILAWVRRGGRLVVALDSDLPEAELSVGRLGAPCDKLQVAAGYPDYTGEKLTAVTNEVLGTSNRSYWPILECQASGGGGTQPYAVARNLGLGSVVVLPSSDLISNVSMVSDDHAHVVMDLMFGTPSVVVFIDTWSGIGEESPFAAVGHGKLNPFLLQLFLVMGVLFWWKGRHFARPRDPPEAHRRAFREHVEALGSQYAKARASRMALGMYAGWALERLRERCQPGGQRRGLLPLAGAIAARTGRDEREVMRILVECESARDAYTAPGEPAEDLKLMRELEALLADTGGIR
ncbi:MAG: DUF4350 domain-containing protein [Myxococcales bacterium]|nr:DUF4350 domain-containing protein [Myxococcales bacterium]